MSNFYVVGGRLRNRIFRRLEEWQVCDRGLLIDLDTTTNKSRRCIEYVSPPGVCPPELPTMQFKSATLRGDKLYACTPTEALVFQLSTFQLERTISLPCFNDVHHVSPSHHGTLLVVVTGLDLVVEVSMSGDLIREWDVLGQDTWSKFSRDIDYRLVPTTKPHKSHPNHVFELENEIWVTRFQQRDAICLTKPGPRIEIGVERPHDGYVFGDKIYFTTVDGHVVIASTRTLKTEQSIDLNQMTPRSGQVLGWCRGVLPVDERYVWVGFTRVRPTKFVENIAWIKHGGTTHKPSHVALYDLKRMTCEQEIELEPHGIGVVFSLLPIPVRNWGANRD
jgi:hypothetical protein